MFQDGMAVIDGLIVIGRHVVIPETLQRQALEQLHSNHMGITKPKPLACESIYWSGMNNDIESHIKYCSACLNFQQIQAEGKSIMKSQANHRKYLEETSSPYTTKLPFYCRLSQEVSCHQKMEDLSVDNLILACRSFFL